MNKRKGNPQFPFYNMFYNQCQYEEDFKLSDRELPSDFLDKKYDVDKVKEIQAELDSGDIVQVENWNVAKWKGEYYISETNKKFSTIEQVSFFMPSWWNSVLYFYED